jgi:hypothetical protein
LIGIKKGLLPMTRLDAAAARLKKALDTLEDAAASLNARIGAAEDVMKKTAALGQEREVLLARVASLEDDSRVLSGLTEEVEARLDGAIGEIRVALGR